MTAYRKRILATVLALAMSPRIYADDVPAGWLKAGHHPEDYEVGLDRTVRHDGEASAFIRSNGRGARGFATLMQTVDATAYRRKRLRFSAYVKAEDVERWAGLWVRVDGQPQGSRYPKALAFDNMHDRPIRGTTGWSRYEIVVDVRKDAHTVSYAVQLSGTGRIWVDDVKVEVVTGGDGSPRR